MAYDPDRLRVLQLAMRRSTDELRSARSTDPAATDAMRQLRISAATLESTWLPLIARLLASDPLSAPQMRARGGGAAQYSLVHVMADGYGWAVQHDVLQDDARLVTPEEARALGARLDTIDLDALLDDPVQVAWLAQQLDIIGRDQSLSVQFLANFHGWADLCDRLAGRRALLLGDVPNSSRIDVAQIDALFARLGATQRHAVIAVAATGCVEVWSVIPQMSVMNPYSAALMTAHLGLDGTLLAQVADALLVRWREMSWQQPLGAPPSDFTVAGGPNTADVLLRVLLADPAASAQFALLAVQHPDVLFATAHDASLVHRMLLLATDPSNTSAADAGAVIVPILDYFATLQYPLASAVQEGYDAGWGLFLVDLITPWTIQFSGLNGDWPISAERKARLIAFVIDDRAALDRLTANAQRLTDGVETSLSAGDPVSVDELAHYIGMLAHLVTGELVDDEQRALDSFNLVLKVAATASVFLPGGVIASGVISIGAFAAGRMVPFDPRRVARDARYLEELTLTAVAAGVATATVTGWLAAGSLPVGFPLPPLIDADAANPATAYLRPLQSWLGLLPGGSNGSLADTVARSVYAFIGPAAAGAALTD